MPGGSSCTSSFKWAGAHIKKKSAGREYQTGFGVCTCPAGRLAYAELRKLGRRMQKNAPPSKEWNLFPQNRNFKPNCNVRARCAAAGCKKLVPARSLLMSAPLEV